MPRRARLVLPAALAVTSLAAPLAAIPACDEGTPQPRDAAVPPDRALADAGPDAPLDAPLDASEPPLDAPPDAPA